MPFYYVVPVVEVAQGRRVPDVPDGTPYCATYGVLGGQERALVRTLVEIPVSGNREERSPDTPVEDTVANMGAPVSRRDPLDNWRLGGQ